MARILIVDDDALDCMIFESLLAQLGHEPTFAASAEVGLEIYDPEGIAVSGRCVDQLS